MADENTQAPADANLTPMGEQKAATTPADAAATAAATQAATPSAPAAAPPAEAAAKPAAPAPGKATPAAEAKPEEAKAPVANPEEKLKNAIIAGNIPQIVMYAISNALFVGTSDIHIEPQEKTVRLRYRVDGVLRHIIEYPPNIHPAVISRLKIMSNMKIDEQRVPQDGRTQVSTEDNRAIELRVSSLPTVNGEKIVMRLQDKSKTIPDLPDLGIKGTALKKMEGFLKLPNGILLVTGPTGSGKTNTLYSCLNRLNTVEVNIMTFEDPVEYQMDGLSQSQIRGDINYDFATGLRTALRQDPDIIMVGEIRDQETIEIAIRAALTGHFVLSTIHTNSAVGTLTRITDMGVQPFLITSSIRGIISQRLVRRVCQDCKEPMDPDPDLKATIEKELEGVPAEDLDPELLKNIKVYKGKGCDVCGQSGYKGRLGIFEILGLERTVADLVLQKANDTEMADAARAAGMISLKQAGFIGALNGQTTAEEVFRISG